MSLRCLVARRRKVMLQKNNLNIVTMNIEKPQTGRASFPSKNSQKVKACPRTTSYFLMQ